MNPFGFSNFNNQFNNLNNQFNTLQNQLNNSFGNFGLPTTDPFLDLANSFNNFGIHNNNVPVNTSPSYTDLKNKSPTSKSNNSYSERDDFKTYQMRDHLEIFKSSKNIISGYLNLGSKDGWEEGHSDKVGGSFARFILVKYILDGKQFLVYNGPVLERAIKGFTNVGCMGDMFNEDAYRPKQSRICYDSGVTGWQKHCVTRMVGNLGSHYDPSKPFFEILINSQRNSIDDPLCKPFSISIYNNEKELDARRKDLVALATSPAEIAHYKFFASNLKKPGAYLKENQGRLGPNSTHLLKALEFLENKAISAQKTGNCWIKQPMRSLLASLFIEYHTDIKEIKPESSWDQAKDVYKRIQKSIAIPYVENLVKHTNLTSQMKESALKGIEIQKGL